MSNKALRWAFGLPIKGASKAVLLALADCLNDTTKRCDPSNATLALYAGVDERTVRRACLDLQAIGLLKIKLRAGTSSQHTLSVGMRVGTPDTTSGVKTPAPRTPRPPRKRGTPDTTPAHPGHHARPTPDTVSATPDTTPPKPLEPPIEPPLNHQGECAPGSVEAVLFPEQSTPEPRSKRRSRETPIKPDWQPSAEGIAYANARGISDIDLEVSKFINRHLAHDERRRDWERSWRTWSDKFLEYNRPRQPASAPPRKGGGIAAMHDAILEPFMTERGDDD